MPGTVTVACRLPHGLKLQLQEPREYHEPVMGGGVHKATRSARVGNVVTLNGFAHRVGEQSEVAVVGGFGLTHGVDADFFEKWMAQNALNPVVQGGFVFSAAKPGATEGMARERKSELSGLEAVDFSNLPGEFRGSVEKAAL